MSFFYKMLKQKIIFELRFITICLNEYSNMNFKSDTLMKIRRFTVAHVDMKWWWFLKVTRRTRASSLSIGKMGFLPCEVVKSI